MQGNIRPQPSQIDEPLWTDPDQKSGSRVRELIFTLHFFFKNACGDGSLQPSPKVLASEEKAITMPAAGLHLGLLLSACGHGIFNVRDDILVPAVRDGHRQVRTSVDLEELKNGPSPCRFRESNFNRWIFAFADQP